MFFLRKPSNDFVRQFLEEQTRLEFSYSAVGTTDSSPPNGYVVDHTRYQLGEGQAVFAAARAALECWQQFKFPWWEAWPHETPIKSREVVAIVARILGLWWLNACRIVYVVDEEEPITKFGFAYGTLPGHAESGEERFLIEWHATDDSVWYDILAFSRPQQFMVRLGYPVVRRKQKQFARESCAAMQRAVDKAVATDSREVAS